MTPDEALLSVLHARPRSVLIIAETPGGELTVTAGPDTSIANINLLLDQAKYGTIKRTMQPDPAPEETPIIGFSADQTAAIAWSPSGTAYMISDSAKHG